MIKSHYGNFWIQPKNHVMENHTMENHVIEGITVPRFCFDARKKFFLVTQVHKTLLGLGLKFGYPIRP